MIPSSAARAHSAFRRALLASLSARARTASGSRPSSGQQRGDRRAVGDRQALAELGGVDLP